MCITFLSLFFDYAPPPYLYTLSLHDALPISAWKSRPSAATICRSASSSSTMTASIAAPIRIRRAPIRRPPRSEEHTSELQSRLHLVCRLLLEKKKKKIKKKKNIKHKRNQRLT